MRTSVNQWALVLATTACLLPATGLAANRCTESVRTGAAAGDRLPPISTVANSVIDSSLAQASTRSDLLGAIATLQENQFAMTHPQASPSQRPQAFFQVRCASADRYRALLAQIQQRVLAARSEYRAERWFLGPRVDQVSMPVAGNAQRQSSAPGLLNLLLIANLYEEFEREAADFLKAAVGDNQAAAYFEAINHIAQGRSRFLSDWDQRYSNPGYGAGGVGLLPEERAGLTRLEGLETRLEPLRGAHVEFWLERESQTFAKLLKEPTNQLLNLGATLRADTSVEQLRLALSVAPEDRKETLLQLAQRRGQSLVEVEKFTAAADYFKLGGAKDKAQRAIAAHNERTSARAEALSQSAGKLRERMLKSDAEREDFESDTGALADELGIDLEDF